MKLIINVEVDTDLLSRHNYGIDPIQAVVSELNFVRGAGIYVVAVQEPEIEPDLVPQHEPVLVPRQLYVGSTLYVEDFVQVDDNGRVLEKRLSKVDYLK